MIAVITHHWAKEEEFQKARELLDQNGFAQSNAGGFIYRVTMLSKKDKNQITSVVIWESDEIYDKWKISPERSAVMDEAAKLWSNPPESERFDVVNKTIIPDDN